LYVSDRADAHQPFCFSDEVCLPLAEEPQAHIQFPTGAEIAATCCVLLDDEPDVRRVAETVFVKIGFDVISASHCAEAIAISNKDCRIFNTITLTAGT
jgi:hypothetical protein